MCFRLCLTTLQVTNIEKGHQRKPHMLSQVVTLIDYIHIYARVPILTIDKFSNRIWNSTSHYDPSKNETVQQYMLLLKGRNCAVASSNQTLHKSLFERRRLTLLSRVAAKFRNWLHSITKFSVHLNSS